MKQQPLSQKEKAKRALKATIHVAKRFGPTVAVLILRRLGKTKIANALTVAALAFEAAMEWRKRAKAPAEPEARTEDAKPQNDKPDAS